MTVPVVAARNFSKTFGPRTVLREVELDVAPGEVHGLIGQNGSGKSTFIKVLSGFHEPDHGAELDVGGETVGLPLLPNAPAELGMFFVHQDLGLADPMSVIENIRAASYRTAFGWRIRWKQERAEIASLLREFNVGATPDARVADLGEVDRALVAILRALTGLRAKQSGLLVLDEATASLPRDGVDVLFHAVRGIAERGMGVLFVSHRLDEVRTVTDRVTVLRDGAVAARGQTADFTERQLIEAILGRSLDQLYPERPADAPGPVRLAVNGLAGARFRDVSFEVRSGELVGLTGLLGMGAEDVLHALFGATRAVAGDVAIGDAGFDASRITPKASMDAGMAFLPADRRRQGGTRDATVRENVTLPTLGSYFRGGLLRVASEKSDVIRLLELFQVTPASPDHPFGALSGGNQQKALLAKWFKLRPFVLLLHEPTQGVDIGAKSQIFRMLHDAAEEGQAIVIASTEYEDLAHMCTRVIVFRDGRAVTELSGNALTTERLIEQCFVSERSPAVAA